MRTFHTGGVARVRLDTAALVLIAVVTADGDAGNYGPVTVAVGNARHPISRELAGLISVA
jgi:hypothetical protein